MLSQWTYVHSDSASATVNSTLNPNIELEGVTSLVHQVGPLSPAAVDTMDFMAWTAGITPNTVLVRTCFKFAFLLYGVYAIMQSSLSVDSQCYAATYDSAGTISLWKASIRQILENGISPIKTFVGPVPINDTWGISLLCQYDAGNNAMQLTVETTEDPLGLPIVEPTGEFPSTVPRMVVIDSNPLSGGINAGPFSAQLGTFGNLTNLDDFDVTQIFTG